MNKDQIWNQYQIECKEIADGCAEEGYPSHGSVYELRAERLWEEEYRDWYESADD